MNLFTRGGLLALAAVCLPACNSMTATSIESLNLAISGKANVISVDYIRSVEADSLYIQAGASEGLFVAPEHSGERVNWYGLTEEVQTDHGRVTQLLGVENDALIPLIPQDPFITGLMQVADGAQVLRYADYPLAYQTGLEQYATYHRGPVEKIDILGSVQPHQRIDEAIWMPQLDYKAINYYWLDMQTGQVRRSIQHISPTLPVMDITLTRLPSMGETP